MTTDDIGPIYHTLRAKMIIYLERRGCRDPEEVVDEALYRAFVNPGVEGKAVESLEGFAFGVLKNVFKEWLRKTSRLAPIDDTPIDPEPPMSDEILDARAVLDKLPPRDRELLIRYLGQGEKAKDLAPEFKLTPPGVRSRVHSLRQKIRKMLARSRLSGDIHEP
jgi:RNA polymerase sigma factor (sigma-70 family)